MDKLFNRHIGSSSFGIYLILNNRIYAAEPGSIYNLLDNSSFLAVHKTIESTNLFYATCPNEIYQMPCNDDNAFSQGTLDSLVFNILGKHITLPVIDEEMAITFMKKTHNKWVEMKNNNPSFEIQKLLTAYGLTKHKLEFCAIGYKRLFPWFVVYNTDWDGEEAFTVFDSVLQSLLSDVDYNFSVASYKVMYYEAYEKVKNAFLSTDTQMPLRSYPFIGINSWENLFFSIMDEEFPLNILLTKRIIKSNYRSHIKYHLQTIARNNLHLINQRTPSEKKILRTILEKTNFNLIKQSALTNVVFPEWFSIIELAKVFKNSPELANVTAFKDMSGDNLLNYVEFLVDSSMITKSEKVATVQQLFPLIDISFMTFLLNDGNINDSMCTKKSVREYLSSGRKSLKEYAPELFHQNINLLSRCSNTIKGVDSVTPFLTQIGSTL